MKDRHTILYKILFGSRYQPRVLVPKMRESLIAFQIILNLFICEGFAYVRTGLLSYSFAIIWYRIMSIKGTQILFSATFLLKGDLTLGSEHTVRYTDDRIVHLKSI